MRRTSLPILLTAALAAGQLPAADPEYVTIEMDIEIDRPAREVWERIGGYCDIETWAGVDCEIRSGDGGIGTVRELAGGRVTEVLVAKTELAYGYTQPAVEGEFYDLYHGFMEARPVDAQRSKLLYTLMYDVSNLEDQAAKEADIERRRTMFEGLLEDIKALVEDD